MTITATRLADRTHTRHPMTPDDPRHGTKRGYQLGCRKHCCTHANTTALKRWRMGWGIQYIPNIGTRRRIHALLALGWTYQEIADKATREKDWVYSATTSPRVRSDTAALVSRVYEALSMRVPPSDGYRDRERRRAAAKGYAPPLAWTDIDDPDESPNFGGTDNDVDPVVVLRVLQGDRIDAATNAERCAVVARWHETGRPYNDLERQTGWQVWRYRNKEEAAS